MRLTKWSEIKTNVLHDILLWDMISIELLKDSSLEVLKLDKELVEEYRKRLIYGPVIQ